MLHRLHEITAAPEERRFGTEMNWIFKCVNRSGLNVKKCPNLHILIQVNFDVIYHVSCFVMSA